MKTKLLLLPWLILLGACTTTQQQNLSTQNNTQQSNKAKTKKFNLITKRSDLPMVGIFSTAVRYM